MNAWLEPPPGQPRRKRGCVGKGCFILCLFILILIISGAVGLFLGLRHHSAIMHGGIWAARLHLLAEEPAPVPAFETTEENIAATERRWHDFENAEDQSARIELSADDVNNLIAGDKHARGKAFVSIEGNRLRLQTSFPLGAYVGRSGYYLNGDIVIQGDGPQSLEHPRLDLITVNDKPVPADLLDWRYQSRSLSDYLREAREKSDVNSIEIRDGHLIIGQREK